MDQPLLRSPDQRGTALRSTPHSSPDSVRGKAVVIEAEPHEKVEVGFVRGCRPHLGPTVGQRRLHHLTAPTSGSRAAAARSLPVR